MAKINWNLAKTGAIYCTKCGSECTDNRCPNCDMSKDEEIESLKSELAYTREGLQKISDECPICIDRGKCNICIAEEYLNKPVDSEDGKCTHKS